MGFVSNASPPRFINEHEVVDAINKVASERLAALDGHRMFVQPQADVLAELSYLSVPYTMVTGAAGAADAAKIARALFTPDAVTLITRKCVNAYWLWYLLKHVRPSTFALTESAISRAHARAKDSLFDNRHGFAFVTPGALEHQLKMLPPGFLLEMWFKGRLVAHPAESGEFSVRLNPLLLED